MGMGEMGRAALRWQEAMGLPMSQRPNPPRHPSPCNPIPVPLCPPSAGLAGYFAGASSSSGFALAAPARPEWMDHR